jgi:hypothetical protein
MDQSSFRIIRVYFSQICMSFIGSKKISFSKYDINENRNIETWVGCYIDSKGLSLGASFFDNDGEYLSFRGLADENKYCFFLPKADRIE